MTLLEARHFNLIGKPDTRRGRIVCNVLGSPFPEGVDSTGNDLQGTGDVAIIHSHGVTSTTVPGRWCFHVGGG